MVKLHKTKKKMSSKYIIYIQYKTNIWVFTREIVNK